MTAVTQNRAFSRISGDTLSLLEEAADQFADDAMLVAAIAIWDNRLTAAAKRLIGTATDHDAWGPLFDYEIMSLVPQAEDGVIGMLKFAQRRRAIMDMPSPAFVIDHRARVLVANDSACALLGLVNDGGFAPALVDPAFARTFRELLDCSADQVSASRSAILRIGEDRSGQFLFEARAKPDGEHGIIVLRKIGIGLTDVGARFLADAFDLTDSEVGVIKLLMEGLQAKEMAARRNTAEATIRSQLKSIFSKTGTSGQTELLRIVSGISLFQVAKTSGGEGNKTFLNARPLSNEGQLVELPNGQFVQVNESGAASGRPFLSLHGLFLGYAFPAIAEELLIKGGLRRFGIMRPGFGRSTPVEAGLPLGDSVDRFADVMDALGIDKCPIVAHGFGGAHAFAFAHRHPDRVSALILVGAFLPAGNMHRSSACPAFNGR